MILPIMVMTVMGSLEFGRALMVQDMIGNTAREGARTGAVTGRSNSDITTAVDNALSKLSLPSRSAGTTLTIKINNSTSVNASAAADDDQISVTVAVPVSAITWLPGKWFLDPSTQLTSTVVMRRE